MPIPASDYTLSFSNSVAAPTLMHVINDAATGLTEVMCKCKEGISALTEIASLLHRKLNRQRLLNTCYVTTLGQQFHSDIKDWRGLVREKRWGLLRTQFIMFWSDAASCKSTLNMVEINGHG